MLQPIVKRRVKSFFAYLLLAAGAVFALLPFFWMVSTSLKTPDQVFVYPPQWIPNPLTLDNYRQVWQLLPFGLFLANTILITGAVTIGSVLSCSLAGYAFARLEWPGRERIFLLYLGTMMIPGAVTMIPVFSIIRAFHWIDTYWALIVPGLFGSAFGTFLLRQFFMTIPKELEEAALIDGCNHFQIYWRIVLPLSKPALATLAVFDFIAMWNSFLWPLIVVNSTRMRTLTIGLSYLQGLYTTDYNLMMAGSVISLIPLLIVFFALQRYFVQGIALTGMKG
ncbi:carbohydrate ABC transporter permease [Candidatus Poribacteria bacterium]|nr:carbohydrate ABC transporter permease [Candidatus Poribacteria bacterium]